MTIKTIIHLDTISGNNDQVGSGQVVASGASGNVVDRGAFASVARAAFHLDVSAIGAGTSLAVFIEAYEEVTGKFLPLLSFPAQTAVTTTMLTPLVIDPLFHKQLRMRWTLTGGTTTATFTVFAYGHSEETSP